MRMFWLVMFACVQQITSSSSPLQIQCDYSEYEAKITYTGDAFAVLATKSNGDQFWFEEDISTASFQLIVLFEAEEEGEEGQCVFDHGTFNIYTLSVQSRKTFKEFENIGDEDFTVECNFELFVSDIMGSIPIDNPIIIPILISQLLGTQSYANFTIKVVKMDGTDLAEGPVALGRLVKLKIEMTPNATEEVGFKPTSCHAMTEDMSISKIILAEGCGTGSPFEQTEGFTTTGFVGFSPTFRMFRMKKDQGTSFSCSFVICTTNCTGNSCPAAATRKKRDVSEMIITNTERENHYLIPDNSISIKLAREKRDVFRKYRDAFGPNITKIVASTSRLLNMPGISSLDTLSGKISFRTRNLTDDQDSSARVLKKSHNVGVSSGFYSDDEPASATQRRKSAQAQTDGTVRHLETTGNLKDVESQENAAMEKTSMEEEKILSSRLVVQVFDRTEPSGKDRVKSSATATISKENSPTSNPVMNNDSNGFLVDKHLTNIDSSRNSSESEKKTNIVVNGDLNSTPILENGHILNDNLAFDNSGLHSRSDVSIKEKERQQHYKEKQQSINTTKKSVNLKSKDKKFKSYMTEKLKTMQTNMIAFSSVATLGLAGLVLLILIIMCVVLRRKRQSELNM